MLFLQQLTHGSDDNGTVLAAVLRLANRHDLVPYVLAPKRDAIFTDEHETGLQKEPVNGLQKEPIKSSSDDSCLRQNWFVDQIRAGKSPSVSSIVFHWKVGMKKAKKDIGVLKTRGVIAFVGARKNGRYVLL